MALNPLHVGREAADAMAKGGLSREVVNQLMDMNLPREDVLSIQSGQAVPTTSQAEGLGGRLPASGGLRCSERIRSRKTTVTSQDDDDDSDLTNGVEDVEKNADFDPVNDDAETNDTADDDDDRESSAGVNKNGKRRRSGKPAKALKKQRPISAPRPKGIAPPPKSIPDRSRSAQESMEVTHHLNDLSVTPKIREDNLLFIDDVMEQIDTIIKDNANKAFKSEAEKKQRLAALRNSLHDLQFKTVDLELIEKSAVMGWPGLSAIFEDGDNLFPHDIVADAKAQWNRWDAGLYDWQSYRGLITVSKVKKMNRPQNHLVREYKHKVPANVQGHNGLENGQWWTSQLAALLDGAIGSGQGGVSGNEKQGALAIISKGKYLGDDRGETLDYYPSAGENGIPTRACELLMTSEEKGTLIRVIRCGPQECNCYAPRVGYRYDGLYRIVSSVLEEENEDRALRQFTLQRCEGQLPLRSGFIAPDDGFIDSLNGVKQTSETRAARRPTDQELDEWADVRHKLGLEYLSLLEFD